MLLFAIAVRIFCKHLIEDEKYALPFMLTLLFYWYYPWNWSGFYHFGLLPLTASYPYWFAFPAALIILALPVKKGSIKPYIFTPPIISIIFISHPLTGSFLIISLSLKYLLMDSSLLKDRLLSLTIPLLGFLAALLWPYFPMSETILKSSTFSETQFSGDWKIFYDHVLLRISPSLLGLPFLGFILLKQKQKFPAVALIVFSIIYCVNYLSLHNSTFSRYIIYVAFYCQLGLVLFLKKSNQNAHQNYVSGLFIILSLLIATPHLIASSKYLTPFRNIFTQTSYSNRDSFAQFEPLKQIVKANEVILAPINISWKLPAIINCKVVGVAHSTPFMADFMERKIDNEDFFKQNDKNSAASDLKRANILKKYQVNYLLIPTNIPYLPATIHKHMKPILKSPHFSLYKVSSPKT